MALITSANAREMARKSHQARRDEINQLRIAANPVPLPDVNNYISRRLFRVREQIERLSDLIDEEEDPQALDRIASALARLSIIERELSGRPLPGTLQPGREKPARLMLSPAVDAGHAQQSKPAAMPTNDVNPPVEQPDQQNVGG